MLRHPRAVRRYILQKLYTAYMGDPLDMITPEQLLSGGEIDRHGLAVAIHYLRDDGLVEVMLGYQPPLFTSARITPRGIDVVENGYEFDRRFPPESGAGEEAPGVGEWMERLVVEAELCNLPRPRRLTLLRDLQFLRAELAQPYESWRHDAIASVLGWIAQSANTETLPALHELQRRLQPILKDQLPSEQMTSGAASP